MFSTLGILTAGVVVCLCIALFLYIQKEKTHVTLMVLAFALVLFSHMVKITEKQEQQSMLCSQTQQVQTK